MEHYAGAVQAIPWVLVALVGLAVLAGPVRRALDALTKRLEGGAALKIGGSFEVAADGTMVTSTADALKLGSVKKEGNPDQFRLLFKVQQNAKEPSTEKLWMKSTKAMPLGGGCIVQVSTERRNPDGSWAIAEALVWVPGATIVTHVHGNAVLTDAGGPDPSQAKPREAI